MGDPEVLVSAASAAPSVPRSGSNPPESTCVLHIGGHKTGSTSIQTFLNGYQDESFLYARFFKTRGNHSYPLWLLFSSRLRIPFHGYSPGFGRIANIALKSMYRVAWARNLQRAGGRGLILSGEGITRLDVDELTQFRDRLLQQFSRVRVIGYARPAIQLIPSLCQQKLKYQGDISDLEGVIAGQPNYSYRAEFAHLYTVFGESNVDISIFDRDCLREGCVVRDFCARLGIPVAGIPITFSNQTLPFELVQLLYLLHRHRSASDRVGLTPGNFERLRARLDKIVDPELRLSFSEAVYRRLFSNMADDLEWARCRFGERIVAIDVPQSDSATVSSIRDLRVLSDSLFARLTTLAPRELRATGLSNTEANAGLILQALA